MKKTLGLIGALGVSAVILGGCDTPGNVELCSRDYNGPNNNKTCSRSKKW